MSNVEMITLGLLHQGFRYGHQLDKAYKWQKMHLWTKATRSSMYQALARMEKKGWVNTSTEKVGNYPERKIYALTPQGESALKEMVAAGIGGNELLEFRLNGYFSFFDVLSVAELISLLEQRKEQRLQLLTEFTPENENLPSDKSTFGFIRKHNRKLVLGYYKMEIEWLEDLIAELKINHLDNILTEKQNPQTKED